MANDPKSATEGPQTRSLAFGNLHGGVYGWHPGRWAWLPIPVLLVAMGAFWAAGWQGSHESVYLLLTLNLVFSLLVCLVVAYLVARSFLVRGTPGLLLLGCGVAIWGPAGVVATAVAHGDANLSITIYNSCLWLSGLCHLAGVSLSLRPRRALSPPAPWLLAGYVLAAGAVTLVTLLALAGWIPTFFVQERGGTPVRQAVLSSAIAMFALTALLLGVTRHQPTSTFGYWYALALLLIAVGLLGVALQSYHAGILGWTGRGSQALGGLYMLIAAAVCVRESRVWGISLEEALQDANGSLRVQAEQLQTLNDMLEVRQRELETANEDLRVQEQELRRQAEALRESEERYRTLFDAAPDAIVVHREGRFLAANDALLRLAGAPNFQELATRSILDFFRPGDREQAADRVRQALAGRRQPIRESTLVRLDGQEVVVELHTGPIDFQGGQAVQTIIRDITERLAAEKALLELNAALERKVAERTAELEYRSRQLQKLTLELSQAHERERKRVAQILHEDLQQQIAGAKFQLNVLSGQTQDDPSRQWTAAQINQILKDAIGMSRSLSHELSPAVFYGNDLGEALAWLGEQMEASHGVAIRVEVSGEGTLQSEALTVFLFRAARELFTNAVRHAGVREVAIRLRRMRRYVGLRVSDEGCGFDPRELKETPGIGLLSIRERVELLGGRVKIASAKGRGTKIRIVVPDGSDGED